MSEGDFNVVVRITTSLLPFFPGQLNASLGDLQAAPDVTRVHRYFTRNEIDSLVLNDVIDVDQTLL